MKRAFRLSGTRAECGWLVLLVLLLAGPAHAHGTEQHSEGASEPEVLAPGYGELAFEPPAPGSYALPPLGVAPDGDVLTPDGSPTTLHDVFAGRVVVLSFIYASCSDVNGCPLASAVLHKLGRRLAQRSVIAKQTRLVSLSFDPERDTPAVMRRYGEGFQIGSEGVDWRFLTAASPAKLEPVLEGYGQSLVEERDADGQEIGRIAHILRVFLIDPERRIRNVYTVSFLHVDTLIADLETLLLEEAEPAAKPGPSYAAASMRPGDDRHGYEGKDYQTRSLGLGARVGQEADLLARVEDPPLGLPAVPIPDDNPITQEKVALGRKLFFDRRLSLNQTVSCAMCHIPEQGFGNSELATAVGIEGRTVRRNAPTLFNVAYQTRLFHDGRDRRLEHQIWGPLLARNEMGNPSVGAVVDRIAASSDYAGLFEVAFPGRGLAMESIGMALASYQRTLVSGGSAFDRWRYGGEPSALGEPAQRGFRIFTGKGGCTSCHVVGAEFALFQDGTFHNTGVGYAASMGDSSAARRIQVAPGVYLDVEAALLEPISEQPPSDLGRYEITQNPDDRWKYKTPTLRNVALTGPYMHDGSLRSLEEVVEFYNAGGIANELLDPLLGPLGLGPGEVQDLVAFLNALTGDDVGVLVGDAFAAPLGDRR
jgi:cytochrome c peroxidase